MKYRSDFVSLEERTDYLKSGKPFRSKSLNEYLRVEPIIETGLTLKAKFWFRHSSAYNLDYGTWVCLDENAMRIVSPIIDFKEHGKQFYITFGTDFLKVTDIRVNEDKQLIFYLEQTATWQLN